MADWRLLADGEASGPWNMGLDEALLDSALSGRPTLRLYRWRGPWLSLGYAQSISGDHLQRCREAGVGVVRRATGGRAVLHGGDLTYSIAASTEDLPDGLAASYALVCRALLSALARIGVRAEAAEASRESAASGPFDCFATSAGSEITVDGCKLVGSAQRRTAGGVLQHGSIRITDMPGSIARATGIGSEHATSLNRLGVDPSARGLERACIAGFEEILERPIVPGIATEHERLWASRRTDSPFHRPLLDAKRRHLEPSRPPIAGR